MSLSIAGRWIKRLLETLNKILFGRMIDFVQKPEKRECCKIAQYLELAYPLSVQIPMFRSNHENRFFLTFKTFYRSIN